MELSIIIVHYKNPAVLKLCLNSILDSFRVGSVGITYEIIIVDSQSSGGLRQLINDKFPTIKLIESPVNTGYAKGVNIGIKASSGKFILILNYDTIVAPGAIIELYKFIKDRPDIGLLGPQLLNFNGGIQKSYFRYYKPITILARRLWLGRFRYFKRVADDFLMNDTDPNKMQAPDWLMGAALMTSRQAVEKVGPMDEKFFFYFEDVDWARRFWKDGFKVIYYPQAKIYHYYGRGSKSNYGIFDLILNKKTRWHVKSAIKFFWKYRHRVVKNIK